MKNEEAKVFLDNLKICINEHPIVADWLVEIENRNDEPSNSENPNNCEPQREECKNCKEGQEDCYGCPFVEPKDEPQTTSTPYKVDTSSICKIEPQTEQKCKRYVITNDEGEKAYGCMGCQTDCAWGKCDD